MTGPQSGRTLDLDVVTTALPSFPRASVFWNASPPSCNQNFGGALMLKASKQTIAKLKAAVKADAARAQAITLAISKTPHGPETGPGRDSLWREKRGGRPNRRYTLLAYAMARGVPYVVVEPTCRQGVDEYKLSRVLGSFVPDIDRVHWSRERIESWAAIRPAVPESEAA